MLSHAKVGTILALAAWLAPLASIPSTGSLQIVTQTSVGQLSCMVPSVDLSNFSSMPPEFYSQWNLFGAINFFLFILCYMFGFAYLLLRSSSRRIHGKFSCNRVSRSQSTDWWLLCQLAFSMRIQLHLQHNVHCPEIPMFRCSSQWDQSCTKMAGNGYSGFYP